MNIPKQLTTVTTLSKLIAGILFVTLPFVGFWLGTQYRQYLNSMEISSVLGASTAGLCAIPLSMIISLSTISILGLIALVTVLFVPIYFLFKKTSLDKKKYWLKSTKVIGVEILLIITVLVIASLVFKDSSCSGTDYLPNIKISVQPNKYVPEPYQVEVGICNIIANSTFQSVKQYPVGRSSEMMGSFKLTVANDSFDWMHGDLVEYGTYTCDDNVIVATVSRTLSKRIITASYNEKTEILNWDGIEYKMFKEHYE